MVSSHRVFKWGLLLLLCGLVLAILHGRRPAGDVDLDRWSDHMLLAAGGFLGFAVVLWVLEKAGFLVSGARCRVCRKRVPYGHALCYDHLRAQTDAAREKYRHRT